jgi:Bifunctional DNA primase/polymerase, N-terminal
VNNNTPGPVDDALRLAVTGRRPVFPCKSAAYGEELHKTPHTIHGFKDATTDEAVIKEWWRQWPDALVGVPTGEASGLFVIDVDSGRHDEANDWLERHSPYLPETRQHATKSGGWHLLFKHQLGLRNSTSKLAKGVDTRGEGGYIIWWPFHTGLNAPHKLDRPLAALPDELIEHLTSQRCEPPIRPRRLCYDKDLVPIIRIIVRAQEGERNSATFWAACRLADHVREGSISEADMIGIVIESACRTGLSERESKQIALSALRTAGARS